MSDQKNPFAKAADKKASTSSKLDKITDAPADIKASVDVYKRIDGEMKRLEGEQAAHKSVLEVYARSTFAVRQMHKQEGNFQIMGEKNAVTYIVQNASSNMTGPDFEAFASRHGQKTAHELLALNNATVRFNQKVLDEPGVMERVVQALNTLPGDLLDRLFTPAYYTVSGEDVLLRARAHAKTPAQYATLLTDLKIKAYIRG